MDNYFGLKTKVKKVKVKKRYKKNSTECGVAIILYNPCMSKAKTPDSKYSKVTWKRFIGSLDL